MVPNDSVEVITSKVAIMTWLTVVEYLSQKTTNMCESAVQTCQFREAVV
jgi:hypothetical protein